MMKCQITQTIRSQTEDWKALNPQDDVKLLVFKLELVKLFKRCPECGTSIRKRHESTQGSPLLVTLKCINDHIYFWNSQPIKGMAAGNLLMSSSKWGHLHQDSYISWDIKVMLFQWENIL